jgi:prepilin-type processing-associated H-X9-DG protein
MRQAVQTLVTVLILATLGALVVPAIAKVREASRRIACTNNMRSLGMAVADYQGDHDGHCPMATMLEKELTPKDTPDTVALIAYGSLPLEKRLSWLVDMIPYLNQDNIYSRMEKDKGWDAEENRFAALIEYKLFHCPGYPERVPTTTLWSSHYLGIAGVGKEAASLPVDDVRAGFFGYDRMLSKKDLIRGESETVMVAETNAGQGGWTAAGPATVRGYDPATAHFGGNHGKGCQLVFADGSVRFIDGKISDAEWRRLVVLKAPELDGVP